MAPYAPLLRNVRRRRAGSVLVLCLAVALASAACGGSAVRADDPAAAYAGVIGKTQASFGTSMVSGTVEGGDTLKITLVDGASSAMARLFLCSQIKGFLADAGLAGSKVLIVDQSGNQLATETDCRG